jgi:hypothetical protein
MLKILFSRQHIVAEVNSETQRPLHSRPGNAATMKIRATKNRVQFITRDAISKLAWHAENGQFPVSDRQSTFQLRNRGSSFEVWPVGDLNGTFTKPNRRAPQIRVAGNESGRRSPRSFHAEKFNLRNIRHENAPIGNRKFE